MLDVGKHFIVGVQGETLTDEERALWRELRPLGVIIFKRNISKDKSWKGALISLISELRELSGREDFISSIDHEGGRVHRLPPPITQFPAARTWNRYCLKVGQAMGKELADLSINLNFAPSFDILTEPKNTVIGDRALATDPNTVTSRALEFLKGLEANGVLGCAKHFPGHGGTVEDSHKRLPVIERSIEELRQVELLPFKRYIESGRELIMTAHVVYKAVDPDSPATLSKKILTDILRGEFGFQGAIITDALDMGALSGISEDEVATRFITAGGDLFCVCQDTNDKDNQGMKISPITSALRYANGIAGKSGLYEFTERSSKCIDRMLTRHREITRKKREVLAQADISQHEKLLKEIISSNV